ncbi:MAG: cobalamin-dependent protein [Deltaproteobacteria bacterium]|nr:MAG: cobalamin-dependent protein [Deltaproteobacteria bacterium]
MKVLLISANTEQINMPTLPLGLACVAAATRKAGHEVAYLDLMAQEDVQEVIKEAMEERSPDVVGISVRNIDDQVMDNPDFLLEQVREVVASCRSFSDAPIVLGGAGYSMYPEAALEYLGADMGIQGEGELAFPTLLDKIQRNHDFSDTPGLCLPGLGLQAKRAFAKNLDAFPFPEDHLWSSSAITGDAEFLLPFQTRRGCPMNCSYCSTSTIEGEILRKRAPALVVEEISRQAEKGFDRFFFVDNTFNLPVSYATELCQKLAAAALDITWRCILYPWRVDEELVKTMVKAGCREVSLGFESGCEPVLQGMNKQYNSQDVRRITQILGEHGIHRMGFLLLGGPGETRESVEESLQFADSLGLEVVKVTTGIRIYPYTALARIALADGVISEDDDLLQPRFYLAEGLEDWLHETVHSWLGERPNWVT